MYLSIYLTLNYDDREKRNTPEIAVMREMSKYDFTESR